MNAIKSILIIFLLGSTTALAEPASGDSVRQLLAVTQARKLVDNMLSQMDGMMNNSLQQALRGKAPTPQQQDALNNMRSKMTALIHQELTWESLEPLYLRLYQESFTEDEVKGMLAFYNTPAGQAVINKMPVLMQKTMLEMQAKMGALMPKIQKIQQEFASEMQAKNKQ